MFRTGNKFAPLKFKPGITPKSGLTPQWSSLGQAGSAIVIAASVLIQYAAVTGPVFVPSTGPPPLAWQSEYPDQVPGKTYPTADQQAFAAGFQPIIPTVTSWEPNYPDRPWRTELPTAEHQFFASGFRPIIPTVTSWELNFPDRPTVAQLPVATSALSFATGNPPIIPNISNWEPSYPDRIPAAPEPWKQFYASPIFPPAAVTVPFVGPVYPDWLASQTFPIAQQQAFAAGFVPIIPKTSWEPGYPDWIAAKPFQVIGGEVRPLLFAATAFPDLSWNPIYPVQFFRPFPEGVYVVGVGPVAPPVAPRGWAAFYPDRFPQPYVPPASGLYAPVMLVPPPTPSTDTTIIVIHRGRFRLAHSKGVVHRGEGRLLT